MEKDKESSWFQQEDGLHWARPSRAAWGEGKIRGLSYDDMDLLMSVDQVKKVCDQEKINEWREIKKH